MVQAEVAARLAAPPGSRIYGVPSAKLAWYAELEGGRAGAAHGLLAAAPGRQLAADLAAPPNPEGDRVQTFAAIDAAFAQRRKTLRAALVGWAGPPQQAEADRCYARMSTRVPGAKSLDVTDFARIARERPSPA